uniref:uncharacterized protein LOC109954515 isoform X2 n=1 Tax=Monopterus albus TaxID=43700 RepID=UPI0009B4562A|nr:uncharacterized protein LOC109954515 isoform X2 [Monopterus albus]
MDLHRPVRHRVSIILLILGHFGTVAALSGINRTSVNLDCTNDFDRVMFCQFEAKNCSEYNITLVNDGGYGKVDCVLQQCDSGQCCCSAIIVIVFGETHTATVLKGGQRIESKTISITGSIKPKTPTIVSVKEFNGNYQIQWDTNIKGVLNDNLFANVTYHKKGGTEKVSDFIKPTSIAGRNYYEILGRHLEPSTTYVVSVKSYTDYSRKFSDSSEEKEFTTSASRNSLLLALIISLSIAALGISGAIYCCYIKFKTKWWDTVAKCPNPKLLAMHPNEQEFLKPEPPIISSLCIEPLIPDDSKPWSKGSLSDTSSGSPQHFSYANTEPTDIIAGVQEALGKAFPNISPISPLTQLTESNKDSGLFMASPGHENMSFGSSGFDNKTYSVLIPSYPHELMKDHSEVQTQVEMVCDSAYHPCEGGTGTGAEQQAPAFPRLNVPPVVSPLMPTDMPYQQCSSSDSGRCSYAEDSSVFSISSGTNTSASSEIMSRAEAGSGSFHEVVSDVTIKGGNNEEAITCDENPCYHSNSFPPVDDDYQAFQSLVEQPEVLPSEQRCGKREEHLDKYPEDSFAKMPLLIPSFMNNVRGGQCLSALQTLFPTVGSADQSRPVITDTGYQSV